MKKFIFFIFTVLSIFLASCTNGLDEVNPVIPFPVQPVSTVTITGNLSVSGAFPEEISRMVVSTGSTTERTAFPKLPTTIVYSVWAENLEDNTKIAATVTDSTYTINIPATSETVSYKMVASATKGENGVELLHAESIPFDISLVNTVVSKDLELKANATGGTGVVSLLVKIDSDTGIHSCRAVYSETVDGVTSTKTAMAESLAVPNYQFKIGDYNDDSDAIVGGITTGYYPMTFEFYSSTNCTGTVLYSFIQGVHVFENNSTRQWVKNGNEPYLNTTESGGVITTTCQITKALVDDYKISSFYVADISHGGTDAGTGTFSKPFKKIEDAVTKMADSNRDYTIYISGSISAQKIVIPSGYTEIQAHSITVCGLNGLDSNGLPNDKITGTSSNRGILINTGKPVTFRSLQICDGNTPESGDTAYKGGGMIIVKSGCVVSLERDVIVNNNKANKYDTCYGGGIYVCEGATLNLKNGSVVGDPDYPDPDITSTAVNEAVKGGGIYNEGTVNMYSGSLIQNCWVKKTGKSVSGGGIYCGTNSTFNMYGGIINECFAIASGSSAAGGGVLLVASASFNMYGGEITNCYATQTGDAISKNGSLKILGTAHIPAGSDKPSPEGPTTIIENDIYVPTTSTSIVIAGELTAHSKTDQILISPQNYGSYTVVERDDTVVSENLFKSERKKFKVRTENNGGNTYTWSVNSAGKLFKPIGTKAYPDAVGDIVYNDGSADPADIASLSDTQQAAAIAVICYKYDTLEPHKLYGLSLKQASNKAWCKSGVAGATAEVGLSHYSHDLDGIGNMEILQTYAGANYTEVNYPAFWWADHYSTTATNLGSYNTGWCLPARNELYSWCDNDTILNTVTSSLSKIGTTYADPLDNTWSGGYWTSSEQSSTLAIIIYVAYHTSNRLETKTKTSGYFVRAVRNFIND